MVHREVRVTEQHVFLVDGSDLVAEIVIGSGGRYRCSRGDATRGGWGRTPSPTRYGCLIARRPRGVEKWDGRAPLHRHGDQDHPAEHQA